MSSKVITLDQLIPCPDSLKLLVLHTPTPMSLRPLIGCVNLFKLDISNNAVAVVPYLGHLTHLKFLFLHNNRLELEVLQQVFFETGEVRKQFKPQSTPLAAAVTWVTYWGNRSEFQARHFLINNTSVIAVDRNLVVEEERTPGLSVRVPAFSPETLLQIPLVGIEERAEGLTEDDYIKHFYQELQILRRRHAQVNPIIKLQSLFRGWKVRKAQGIEKLVPSTVSSDMLHQLKRVFGAWKYSFKNRHRLQEIMQRRGKEYLVHNNLQMKKRMIVARLKRWAREACKRVNARMQRLKMQYRIAKLFRLNRSNLEHLYQYLELHVYGKVYAQIKCLSKLREYVFPLIEAVDNSSGLVVKQSNGVWLLRGPTNRRKSGIPFVSIVLPAASSLVIVNESKQTRFRKLMDRKGGLAKKSGFLGRQIRYAKQHIPATRGSALTGQDRQLLEISGSLNEIRSLLRGVYHFNSIQPEQLVLYPQKVVRMVSCAIRVQKAWRGYQQRKKSNFREELKQARAAVTIQRWYRGLAYHHRWLFLHRLKRSLQDTTASRYFLKLSDYVALKDIVNKRRLKFLEQNVEVVVDQQNRELSLRWEASAAIKSMSQVVELNQRLGRGLFGNKFITELLGKPLTTTSSMKLAPADCYHLVHFNTKCSRVRVLGQNYLMVDCSSPYEAKLRMFGLKLLTYSFRRQHNIEICDSINYKGSLPKTTLLKLPERQHLFIMMESTPMPASRQLYPCSIDKILELTIYLKETPNTYPVRSSERLRCVLCRNNPSKQKQCLPLPTTEPNRQANLHVQLFRYQQEPSQASQVNISSVSNTHEDKKKLNTKRRRSKLEQLSKLTMSFDSVGSSLDINVTARDEKVTETSLLMLSPKSNFVNFPGDKFQARRMLTEPSLALETPKYKASQANLSLDKSTQRYRSDGNKGSEECRFVNQFVNVSNFLSKEYVKTELRNRHYRMLSEVSHLAHKSRIKERQGLQFARMQRQHKLCQAKMSFLKHRQELLESKQQQRESWVQTRNIMASHRAQQKQRSHRRRRLDTKRHRRNSRLAFPEELYPMAGEANRVP